MTSLPEQEAVAVAGSWLDAAEEELDAVERLLRDDSFVPRHVCVLANAAARKALTALLSVGRTPFSRRHDLDALLRMLPLHSLVRRDVPDLHDLAQWAAEPRFPGDWQEASVEDARRAARQARDVLEAVLSDLVEQGTRIGTPRA
jgi:HEPN domain-containing protein